MGNTKFKDYSFIEGIDLIAQTDKAWALRELRNVQAPTSGRLSGSHATELYLRRWS